MGINGSWLWQLMPRCIDDKPAHDKEADMNKIYRFTAFLGMLSLTPPCTQAAPQVMTDAQLRTVNGQGVLMPSYLVEPRIVVALNQLAGRLDQQGYDRAAQALHLEASWLNQVLPPRGPHCMSGKVCPF